MAAFNDWQWDIQYGDDDDDEANEGEEREYSRTQWGTRDGLIFLVDCTLPMFDTEEEQSPFELCIKCAKCVIQNKIISSEKDLLGIVFFGTEKSKNDSGFKHIYVLHDLDQPGAASVLELEAFLEEEANNDFEKEIGHSDDFSLSDALWTCYNMFSQCSQKIGSKRVMLFTNNDNPHRSQKNLQRQAKAKAEDLHQNGIDLELMHLNKEGEAFDVSAFYKEILYADDDENVLLADPAEKFEELLTRVRSKDHKKRSQGRIPFSLGGDLDMSVGVYNLVRTCYKPATVKLYKKTNEEVKTVTKTILQETGEILMPQDIKKGQVYGGQKICFEKEEVNEIKKFDKAGLKLMGFKPRSCLKRYYHIKPAQFIYPDENIIKGSTTLFSALLRKCLDRDVVPICSYIPRRNAPPRFVCLLAQDEELDEHKVQVTPPGFHVNFLPFADDLRKLTYEDTPRANTDQVDKAKELIKKLQFTYKPESFENPTLQKHYVNLEAMALDRDAPEDITDYTMPDETRMDKRAGVLLEEFSELVFPEGYEPGKGKKRAPPSADAAAKKAKTEEAMANINLEDEAVAGRLGKLTVAVLKELAKKAKMVVSGSRKQDYIDAINEHFGV